MLGYRVSFGFISFHTSYRMYTSRLLRCVKVLTLFARCIQRNISALILPCGFSQQEVIKTNTSGRIVLAQRGGKSSLLLATDERKCHITVDKYAIRMLSSSN